MRLAIILFISLIAALGCYSQKNHSVSIKGSVRSANENDPVINAYIFTKLEGGYILLQKTDSAGKYQFNFTIDKPSSYTVSIGTDKLTISKYHKYGFLANKNIQIGILNNDTIIIKDFTMSAVIACGPVAPAVLFNTNSIISCNDSLAKIDSISFGYLKDAVINLHKTLIENPTIIIEMQGHASSIEKNPEQLALYRTQIIKEILIAKGINKNRLLTKSWGNQKLLIRDNIIKKAKTKEEKLALHLKNQRVVFRIISWDFKE